MSGHISGLQTLVTAVEKKALFVHCRAHNLNLTVSKVSIENVSDFRNIMQLVQKFVAFARGSPKRLACFKHFQTSDGTNLRPFCPTRWILRKPSVV